MKDSIDDQQFRLASGESALSFTEVELEEVRKTKLYGNIEDSPTEVLLVLCSFLAQNKSYKYAQSRIKERYKLQLDKNVYAYLRLKEPFLTVIKRFKQVLEAQLQYIPIYSKAVRLKELQAALALAKTIPDVGVRAKTIVEVLRTAHTMMEGKRINIETSENSSLTVYHKVVDQIHKSNAALPERREALRGMAELFKDGKKEKVPIYE